MFVHFGQNAGNAWNTELKIVTSLLPKGRTWPAMKEMVLLTCLLGPLTSSHTYIFSFNLMINLRSTFTNGFIDIPETAL